MDGVLHDTAGVLRFILLVGFLFAGVAKFRNSAQTRQMLVEFGVPSQLVGAGALALPLLEILTAAALAMSETIGGWLALALLLTFSAAIQANLSLGRHPDCHCFGQLKAYPIGRPLLVRNAVLALAAATVIWMSGHSTISPTAALLEQMTAGQRVILILSGIQMFAIVVLGVVAWQIVRQQGRMLIRLDRLERTPGGEGWTERMPELRIGVPMGASAPNFALSNVEGAQVRLKELLGRGALVLVFSSPHCGPCQQLLPQLKIWTERFQDRLTIVIVSEGSAVDHKSYPIPERVLLQHQREVAEQYQAWGTPSAVLVRPDGSIGSGVAAGAEQIGALVEHVGRRTEPGLPGIETLGGDVQHNAAASELALPDIEGVRRPVLQGRQGNTLLLFWNTHCGFCQRMEGRLKRWMANRLDDDLGVVLIANGDMADLRSFDELGAQVFMDTAFMVGAAYGARGTPMAVLVNPEGSAASTVVAGEDAIFALLN